jgi:hypothetical protein
MCSVFVAPSGDRTRSCFGTPSASAAATGLFGVATARDASGAVIFGEVGNAATRVVLDRAHGRAIDARVIRGMPVFQFFVIVVPGRGSGTLQAVDTSGHALRVRRVAWS